MCGRYSIVVNGKKIQQQIPFLEEVGTIEPNYNVAPTQRTYVITNEAPSELSEFRWGLVPFWSKEGKPSGRMINARLEGIETKPSFRGPIKSRRCLVLADSFYEWKRHGKEKIPYRIMRPDEELLVFAGIWEKWDKGEKPLYTFSIITTEPNREMKFVHNRMPMVLPHPEQWDRWLNAEGTEAALKVLRTPADGTLDMYRVPSAVGNVRNNGPELHQAVEENLPLE